MATGPSGRFLGVRIIGVDWARAAAGDFTVLDIDTGGQVLEIDRDSAARNSRFNSPDRLEALFQRYQPLVVIAESNSMGLPMIERLAGAGMRIQPFSYHERIESRGRASAGPGLRVRGAIRIPNDAALLGGVAGVRGYPATIRSDALRSAGRLPR